MLLRQGWFNVIELGCQCIYCICTYIHSYSYHSLPLLFTLRTYVYTRTKIEHTCTCSSLVSIVAYSFISLLNFFFPSFNMLSSLPHATTSYFTYNVHVHVCTYICTCTCFHLTNFCVLLVIRLVALPYLRTCRIQLTQLSGLSGSVG